MRPEALYLADIVEAADAIGRFLQNVGREQFVRDEMLMSSVLHKLMIIGEAAAKIPPDVRLRHADIEWSDIVGFRNIIVHEYFSVRWPSVWTAATQDVPALRLRIAAILTSEYPETSVP